MSTHLFHHRSTSKHANHISQLNIKYNIKYKIVGLGSLKDTLYRYTEVNYDLNIQLSIIIIVLLTLNFIYSA